MRRRLLQFRLRTLLGFLVLLCIMLGAWSLFGTFFGPYVGGDPVLAGQPIRVRGRFIDFLGGESTKYVLTIRKRSKNGREFLYQSTAGSALRRGLCLYEFEVQLQPVSAGTYFLSLFPETKAVQTAPKGKPRPDVVFGKITVMPSIKARPNVED